MLTKNLTRKNLHKKIYQNIGFSKNLSKLLVDSIFKEIIDALKENDEVKIKAFGAFKKITKSERIGRNPKTKEEFKISARHVVVFKASKKLKILLNEK